MPRRASSGEAPATPPPVPWLTADGDDTIVAVSVVPRASRTGLDGEHDGRLRVRLTAPPVDGAANAALLVLLSECCGVPGRAVSLVSGEASRRKRVRVTGLAPADVLARLSQR